VIPDSVLAAYVATAVRMHGSAGKDIGDKVTRPDGGEQIGEYPGGEVWRVADGWGEYYFADPKSGEAKFVACKMPDVMAYDLAAEFRDKIQHKDIGMGDVAWDRAVVDAVGGKMMAEKAEWTEAYVNDLPDSSFAYVEPGGTKDAVGKTTPRVLRRLPYKTAEGAVDSRYLTLALSSVEKTSLPKSTQARVTAKLEAVAKSLMSVLDEAAKLHDEHIEDPKTATPNSQKKLMGLIEQAREIVKTKGGPGSRVQTLVFDKGKYKGADEAKAWASDHGFKSEKVDETGESFRLRQEDPGAFARMRTIDLTEGVQAVVGFPKKSIDAIKDAYFTTASGRLAFKASDLAAAEFEAVEETSSGVVYRVKVGGMGLYFAESGGSAAYLPTYAALDKTSYVPISKSSDEKRYTLGVVYPASKKGKPEPDFHGDVMSEDEIEKSAWGFMGKGNDRVGLMHRPGTTGAGRVVESYVYRGPAYKLKDATNQEQEISPGDWMLGVVWEPEAWKAIKSGTITGYSLQGAARKEAF
jgi:hypothetical protein